MNKFAIRHFERLERWSSVLLAMGCGYLILLTLGTAGFMTSMAVVFLASCLRVYLFGVVRPAVKKAS